MSTATRLDAMQAGLLSLLGTLSGIPSEWGTRPQKFTESQIVLNVTQGPVGVGVDERVQELLDDAGALVTDPALATQFREVVLGLREMTVQVSVWTPRQKLSGSGRTYLEIVRTRLRWRSSIDTLRGLGLALVRIAPTETRDVALQSREFSQARMDIRFAFGVAETSPALPFISTVRVVSDTIDRADGDPEPDALQQDFTGPPSP